MKETLLEPRIPYLGKNAALLLIVRLITQRNLDIARWYASVVSYFDFLLFLFSMMHKNRRYLSPRMRITSKRYKTQRNEQYFSMLYSFKISGNHCFSLKIVMCLWASWVLYTASEACIILYLREPVIVEVISIRILVAFPSKLFRKITVTMTKQ